MPVLPAQLFMTTSQLNEVKNHSIALGLACGEQVTTAHHQWSNQSGIGTMFFYGFWADSRLPHTNDDFGLVFGIQRLSYED
jgi:hypothetical protein